MPMVQYDIESPKRSSANERKILPVLIIPGFMSSGLEVQQSSIDKSWIGKRVWIDLPRLGFHSLHTGGALSNNEEKKGEEGFSETLHREFEIQSQCKSDWVQHVSLQDDMCTERDGIKVRPAEGLTGVDYLTSGPLMQFATYVFGPVIKVLKGVGYTEGKNVDAAPYDWRVPPIVLESRDSYFSSTMTKIENLYKNNDDTPVVLLCHSLGCKTAHYLFNFILNHPDGGKNWLQKYVHTYMPIGAPTLGAPKAIRATVCGDKMSLDTFLSDEEALILARSFGSGAWLMPNNLPKKNAPPNIFLRREGWLRVTVSHMDCMALFQGREKNPPSRLRLCMVLGEETLVSDYKNPAGRQARIEFPETFTFAAPVTLPTGADGISDRFRIILQEPGFKYAKKEKKAQTGVMYSPFCWPLRFILTCVLKILKYLICCPCAIVYNLLQFMTKLTLKSADFTASAMGSATLLASSEEIRLSQVLAGGGQSQARFTANVVHFKKYQERGWFSSLTQQPRSISVTVQIQWVLPCTETSSDVCSRIAVPSESATVTPVPRYDFRQSLRQVSTMIFGDSSDATDTPTFPIHHKKNRHIQYISTSGDQLFHSEGLSRLFHLIRTRYDTDPVGPRTLSADDAPPVKRVKAVYGVNLPTEVGAIYKHQSLISQDSKIQNLHKLDKSARLQQPIAGGYKIEKGLVMETKDTPQNILGAARGPRTNYIGLVHRSGDGTVPYWSLQHCRTWQGVCDVTVEEIEGAEHREILANAEFHKILVNYVTQQS